MLKIHRENQKFEKLDSPTLADVSISERYDLQEFITNSPEAFFSEIGQELFLIGTEIEPSDTVQDRIDILAVDREGCCVIIELKRGSHKLQMLQAISYAGMIAQWSPDDFLQLLNPDDRDALSDFLECEIEDINRSQRIILVAEAYDYALLVGTEWLNQQYGVEIFCCRISLATDSSNGTEYLVCSSVYPAPELASEAIPRGRRSTETKSKKWTDWDSALHGVTNPAVINFFRKQLENGVEQYLPKRRLRYKIDGKRRWHVHVRRDKAYSWQHGRFIGDEDYWKKGLSSPEDVVPVDKGKSLRLHFVTEEDFRFFLKSASNDLCKVDWIDQLDVDDENAEADLE